MALRVYGNRRLRTLEGLATRPTPGRVREALFNIWRDKIEGCHWLDLCTGIGSLGAEALLRGAQSVVGIELAGAAVRVIEENWQRCAQEGQSFEIIRGDVVQGIHRLRQKELTFDCIYFDPPYQSDLYEPVLNSIAPLLKPQGELVAEHLPRRRLPEIIGGLSQVEQRVYGHTSLSFYQLRDVD
ncbi:16S rRNA (guanine(966)-N(2))-methyltransferase RsmD [Leptolyngbya sp. FACHB-261]|uniref:16S rRNA (guanine(966)-N(2))-methyltransferase RsmD n=1 Tax=Leptolyngbya sp. FACHB-261 TaxID=2692806 RepID=UPI001686AA61|nr:16S rRNA (guanine(966)-N(2))-methyltransferase RsmD [Leptolyngbya sp. FACHB-261]MBD2105062.1 16S rRNA (guanine(966)-N(2))-methyltransferase RsmD [Leptolyngbya sp. FACHB-261]